MDLVLPRGQRICVGDGDSLLGRKNRFDRGVHVGDPACVKAYLKISSG